MSTRRNALAMAVLLAAVTLLPARTVDAAFVGGSSGSDILFGTNAADEIRGGPGSDILFGKRGADRLFGESGDDTLFGSSGRDILDGGASNDTIYDDDSLPGDKLRGGEGNDTLLSIDGAADRVNCGPGIDTAFIDRGVDVVAECERVVRRGGDRVGFRVNIGSNGTDFFDTGRVRNLIFARDGDDFIRAGDDDDILLGGGGTDFFRGEDDDDVLIDDDGTRNDFLRPGLGKDIVFSADGARNSVNCGTDGDDGDDDIVFADAIDSINDCGTVAFG